MPSLFRFWLLLEARSRCADDRSAGLGRSRRSASAAVTGLAPRNAAMALSALRLGSTLPLPLPLALRHDPHIRAVRGPRSAKSMSWPGSRQTALPGPLGGGAKRCTLSEPLALRWPTSRLSPGPPLGTPSAVLRPMGNGLLMSVWRCQMLKSRIAAHKTRQATACPEEFLQAPTPVNNSGASRLVFPQEPVRP